MLEKCWRCNQKYFPVAGVKTLDGIFLCKSCAKRMLKSYAKDDLSINDIPNLAMEEFRTQIASAPSGYESIGDKVINKIAQTFEEKEGLPAYSNNTYKLLSGAWGIDDEITFEDDSRRLRIFTSKLGNRAIAYADIIDFELVEDSVSLYKGGLGRAVAGDLLFGGVGAIVGAATGAKKQKQKCKSLELKLTLGGSGGGLIYLRMLDMATSKNSPGYKKKIEVAREIISRLQRACNLAAEDKAAIENAGDESANGVGQLSPADEILKYKQLLDIGAITQDEYDKKKEELLNL